MPAKPRLTNAALMALAAQQLERFARAACVEMEHTLARTAQVREGKAPGTPVGTLGKTSDHPGEARGSLRVTLNEPSSETSEERTTYPLFDAAQVDAALAPFELGDTIMNRWIADHASILEGGRRLDKNGRMIGSDQAPDGFVHLAIDETTSQMDRWRWDGA